MIDLLTEQLLEGMSPRQVAEPRDKNYHTTRLLPRKIEDAGEIQHTDNFYFAILNDIARNQRNQHHHCNQYHQLVTATLLPQTVDRDKHVREHSSSSTDYSDDTDYADDRASSDMFDTHEPGLPPVNASL